VQLGHRLSIHNWRNVAGFTMICQVFLDNVRLTSRFSVNGIALQRRTGRWMCRS
jgi:hypothetical protein